LYQFTPNLQGFLLPHTIHNIRLLLRLGIPVQKLNKRFRRTYSASFVDLDEDGHLDLLKVNDFAGFDLFYNNGKGVFRNVTQEIVVFIYLILY